MECDDKCPCQIDGECELGCPCPSFQCEPVCDMADDLKPSQVRKLLMRNKTMSTFRNVPNGVSLQRMKHITIAFIQSSLLVQFCQQPCLTPLCQFLERSHQSMNHSIYCQKILNFAKNWQKNGQQNVKWVVHVIKIAQPVLKWKILAMLNFVR